MRTQAGPDEHHDLRIEGAYLIIEKLEFYDGANLRIWPGSHHVAVRDSEIHNPEDRWVSTGSALSVGETCHDVVAYRNHIHHNRRLKTPPDVPEDLHGVTIGAAAERVWVLGNHIHHNSGDAFQAAHRAIPAPRFVYVGGNVFHHDRENGVDLKSIQDVIVSQNVMYGYEDSATSSGDAVVVGSNGLDPAALYGPRRSWILFNEIYGSLTGIRVEGAQTVGSSGIGFTIWRGTGLRWTSTGTRITSTSPPTPSDPSAAMASIIIGSAALGTSSSKITSSAAWAAWHVAIGSGLVDQVSMSHCLLYQHDGDVAVRWGANDLLAPPATRINALPGCWET